jgi:amino acid transporter
MVFFAYIGFQVVAQIGGEIRESERTVPLATLVSLVIVAALYTGTTIALLAAHLPSYGSGSVFDAAKVLIGPMGALIVALGAVFSTLSSANANVVGSSRIILTMAAEKQIPGRFARISYGQPANSILFSSVVVLLLIIYGNLTFIVDLTNLTTLATMFLVNVSAFLFIRLEQKKPSGRKFFRLPLGVLIPVLGGVSCILMALTLSPFIIVIGLLFLFGGTALYILEDTPQGNAAIQEIRKILYQRDGNNR